MEDKTPTESKLAWNGGGAWKLLETPRATPRWFQIRVTGALVGE